MIFKLVLYKYLYINVIKIYWNYLVFINKYINYFFLKYFFNNNFIWLEIKEIMIIVGLVTFIFFNFLNVNFSEF